MDELPGAVEQTLPLRDEGAPPSDPGWWAALDSSDGSRLKKGITALLVMAAAVAGWMQGAPAGPRADVHRTTREGPPVAQKASVLGLLPGVVPEGGPGDDPDLRALLARAEGPPEREPAGARSDARTSTPAHEEAPSSRAAQGDGTAGPEGEAPEVGSAPDGQTSQPRGAGKGPVRFLTHRVRQGETLWDIAEKYGTDVNAIASANGLYDLDYLRPGQVLEVPSLPGVVHTVQAGETLWEISRLYGVSMQAIQQANGLSVPEAIRPGRRLLIPGATQARVERLVAGGRLQRAFSWPVRGPISSGYGWRWGRMHEGVDIAVPSGTPVRAAAAGRVVYAGWAGNYGYLVSIDHGNGVVTRYGHNSRIVVRVGQRVSRGQIVAYSGNTGNSTGPHLHFEIRYRGRPVDPMPYLR